MTGPTHRTGWAVALVRTAIDGTAPGIGWLLGGPQSAWLFIRTAGVQR
jgi:hypothetical protein